MVGAAGYLARRLIERGIRILDIRMCCCTADSSAGPSASVDKPAPEASCWTRRRPECKIDASVADRPDPRQNSARGLLGRVEHRLLLVSGVQRLNDHLAYGKDDRHLEVELTIGVVRLPDGP